MAQFNFRHGIARHQEDGVGNPTFLQVNSGYVDLLVQPDPTVFLIAHNTANYIYVENITVPQAWGPFGSDTYWLYWDVDFLTGELSRGYTTLPPVYQSVPPYNPQYDQHWFDVATMVQKRWTGTQWVELLRVFAAQLINGVTLIPQHLGSQVGANDIVTYAGFPIIDPDGNPVQKFRRDRKGEFITTETPLSAQFTRNINFRIESVIEQANAQENIPINYCIAYNNFNKVVLARNNVPQYPAIGVAAEDMATGETRSFITRGFVTNELGWDFSQYPAGQPLYVGLTGMLTPDVTQLTSLQRMGYVVDRNTAFIDPHQIIRYNSSPSSNLVQMHLDRETGELIATNELNELPPGANDIVGYVHHQAVADTTWIVTHNMATHHVIAQIYDASSRQVFPDDVEVVDINTIKIEFKGPQAGTANLVLVLI